MEKSQQKVSSQIDAAMRKLGMQTEHLNSALEVLVQKIAPVLREKASERIQPQDSPTAGPQEEKVALARVIHEQANILHRMGEEVEKIIDRIEL